MKTKFLLLTAAFMLIGSQAFSQCKGKCRNGKGVYTFENGEVYDGYFKDGKFEGKGTYTYKSGAKYIGDFKDASGTRQVGEFEGGELVDEISITRKKK
jgi:hypothetical protein